MLNRWTRTMVRHRFLVLAIWALIGVLGVMAAGDLSTRLTTSLDVAGSQSARANALLATRFHENVEGSFTIVIPPAHQSVGVVETEVRAAVGEVPSAQVLQLKTINAALYVEADTDVGLVRAATLTGRLRAALAAHGLSRALVTGPAALQADVTPVLRSDLRRGEVIALVVALLLLVATLGLCGAVVAPFVVAGATATASLLVVDLLAHRISMVLYVPNVIELIGLGLAIDYSLLIVHRFRAEMAGSPSVDGAVVTTMSTAGRTVVVSGLAVATGLAAMVLVPVPFVRSLGAAGTVVPLVSIVAALTLQPALLALLGARGLRTVGIPGLMGEGDALARWWSSSTRAVTRHPGRVVAGALGLVALGATSVGWLQLTPGSLSGVPSSLASARANAYVINHVGPGLITPVQVLLVAPPGGDWRAATWQRVETRLGDVILAEDEVRDVAVGLAAPYVDATGRVAQMFVITGHPFGAEQSQSLVGRIRALDVPAAHLPRGVAVYVGGATAQGVDFLHGVDAAFPLVVALALAVALLILWAAFGSLALAVLAVVLDLASVVAAVGVSVAVFRFGVGGALLGTYHVSQIEGWVPIFVFAMLFGLSMDYEVFIVARIREARQAGLANEEALRVAMASTGGVVSTAALIMVGALAGLVGGHVAGLQELGVGLAAGVLIDASVMRALVVPAALTLLGERAWSARTPRHPLG
jgi:uncharacterized membrane protein YdfJ with MMPL/SSD domain